MAGPARLVACKRRSLQACQWQERRSGGGDQQDAAAAWRRPTETGEEARHLKFVDEEEETAPPQRLGLHCRLRFGSLSAVPVDRHAIDIEEAWWAGRCPERDGQTGRWRR